MTQGRYRTTRGGQSRRAVLGAALGGALLTGTAGCRWLGANRPEDAAAASPLAPTMTGTLALIDTYTATIAAQPTLAGQLNPLLDDHQACADALRTAMGGSAPPQQVSGSGSAAPSATVPEDPTAALAAVRAAEQAARDAAVKDCLAARPQYASLLGSIAAGRACHLEVLA
jgi:hypothetical protein